MESFRSISAVAAPLMRINIDTDQIIPGRFLIAQTKDHLAASLFANWRYKGDDKTQDPAFVLNREPYRKAQVLIVDRNFGCGSSRETAPMALRAWGIRAVIAPLFGGIFYNNCFRNGIVPVVLPAEVVHALAAEVEASQGARRITVDLEKQTVQLADGQTHSFTVAERPRQMLLKGQDEIDLTLGALPAIEAFRAEDRRKRPWAYL